MLALKHTLRPGFLVGVYLYFRGYSVAMFSLMLRPLCLRGKWIQVPLHKELLWPQRLSRRGSEKENILLSGIEARLSGLSVCTLVTVVIKPLLLLKLKVKIFLYLSTTAYIKSGSKAPRILNLDAKLKRVSGQRSWLRAPVDLAPEKKFPVPTESKYHELLKLLSKKN